MDLNKSHFNDDLITSQEPIIFLSKIITNMLGRKTIHFEFALGDL